MTKTSRESKEQPSFMESMSKGLDHMSSRNIQIALILALLLSIASVLVMNFFGGAEQFRKIIESTGPLAPVAFILLKSLTYVIAPLSGTPLKLASGALFGFWEGALLALVGDVLGACLNFWIARLFRLKAIVKLAGKSSLKQIDETTEHIGGWRALLVARLVLSPLYDFISYAAGLSNLTFRQFFLVTLLAGIPSTFLTALMGDSLIANPPLFFGMIGFGLVSVLLLSVLGRWLRKE